ncbi:rhomboid family intramembrane serine protease [Lachnospiraceae bacterium KK002]
MSEHKKLRLSFNSPVILSFTIICFLAMLLNDVTGGITNRMLFSVYRSSLLSPLTYLRFFGHVLGHAGWEHFFGNITLILVVGPLLEEKYGSANLLFVMLATALTTGLVHFIFFPRVGLLGASGVVFALILLSSITCVEDGAIPITFLLVAVIYIGQQVYQGIFIQDNVSNLTHILGGIVGASLGYVMNKNKMTNYSKRQSR